MYWLSGHVAVVNEIRVASIWNKRANETDIDMRRAVHYVYTLV